MNKTEYLVLVAYKYDTEPYNNMICEDMCDTLEEAEALRDKLIDRDDVHHVDIYESHKL